MYPTSFKQLKPLAPQTQWSNIKLLALDVDGTLTDGGMYYGVDGEVMKKFYTPDGMGIKCVQALGIEVLIITGEQSPIVSARARKLGIEQVFLGIKDKLTVLGNYLAKQHLHWEQVCYVGDDINDLDVMEKVAIACAPQNAVPEIQQVAHLLMNRSGGQGAVRDVCDLVRWSHLKKN